MTKHRISALTLAIGFVLSTCAVAQNRPIATPISKAEYKAGKDQADATYKAAKQQCKSIAGNSKDICMAEAKAQEKTTKADLEARYKNTEKAWYNARLAVADGNYSIAKEKCDDKAGNGKDVCMKSAKATYTTVKADAKVQKVTTEVRKEAVIDKRDAEYAVAKEKCDALAGDAKTRCVNDAKARFGKT
jgi:hypothetical protein